MMAANKFNEWWNDNCAEMFEWDYDNIAKAAWEAAVNSSEALKPTHNSAIDAIALAKKFHSTLDLGKMELERVTIQRFMVFVQEQLHHGADVVRKERGNE